MKALFDPKGLWSTGWEALLHRKWILPLWSYFITVAVCPCDNSCKQLFLPFPMCSMTSSFCTEPGGSSVDIFTFSNDLEKVCLFLLLWVWVFDSPVCLLTMYIQYQWKPEQEVGSSTLWTWSYRWLVSSSLWVLETELQVLWKSHWCSSLWSPLSTCFKYLTSMTKFARKYPCKIALPTRP